MKKTAIIFTLIITSFSTLSGCLGTNKSSPTLTNANQSPDVTPISEPIKNDNSFALQQIVYENNKYNFAIQIPKNWEGKYTVMETDTNVTFTNISNQSAGGLLFQIRIWDKQKWNEEGPELVKNIHIFKIGEQGNIVFTLDTPTDVEYKLDDENKKKEYLSMSEDVEGIKSSFVLKNK